MKVLSSKHIPSIVAIVLLLISIGVSFYFTLSDPGQLSVSDLKESNIQREELQRYFGYDQDLLRSYLSVPYDVSINTNQSGTFVDIGYLYIIFVPLIFIGLLSRRLFQWVSCVVAFLLFIISVSTSYVSVNGIKVEAEEFDSSNATGFIDHYLALIFKYSEILYVPIDKLISSVSGTKDHISYPLIILLFIGFMIIVSKEFSKYSKKSYAFVSILSIYGLFFVLFSSGVIWYGFMFFILSLIGILYYVYKGRILGFPNHNLFRYGFALLVFVWLFMGTMARISNVQRFTPEQHKGKTIIHPDVFLYNTGEIESVNELIDIRIPGFSQAIEKVNSDLNTKVYTVGTGLSYFIKDNHKRMYSDNQLGTFYWIMRLYKHRYVISDVLKASGFKYIIIDLNTSTVDQTPEQTLRNKFIGLLDYLTNNDSVSLLCTDNIVRDPETNSDIYSIEGEITRRGSFAIYEIH